LIKRKIIRVVKCLKVETTNIIK